MSILKSKATVVGALPTLVFGAAFIGAMIGTIDDQNRLQIQLDQLSEPSSAQVRKIWWRFDIDMRKLKTDAASNWGAYTRPSLCTHLTYQVADSPASAVSCLRYPKILDGYRAPFQLADWTSAGAGWAVELPWITHESNPGIEIHMDEDAWHWFSNTPSVYQMQTKPWRLEAGHGQVGSMTYWDEFLNAFDRPADYVVDQWQQSNRVAILHNPENPSMATPVDFVEAAQTSRTLPFMITAGLFGIILWSIGVMILLRESKFIWRVAVLLVTLAAAPWWGQTVWRALDFLHSDASAFGEFVNDVMLRRAPTVAMQPPDFDGRSDDKRIAWSMRDSIYGPILNGMDFKPPEQPLEAAAAQERAERIVSEAMTKLSPQARANRFWLLACYSAEGQRGAGSLFLPAAQRWQADPSAGKATRAFLNYHSNGGTHFHNIDCAAALD